MTTSNNDQHQEPRRKAGSRRKETPAVTTGKASRTRPPSHSYLPVVPDCIHDDEALWGSWEAMQESGGWR